MSSLSLQMLKSMESNSRLYKSNTNDQVHNEILSANETVVNAIINTDKKKPTKAPKTAKY